MEPLVIAGLAIAVTLIIGLLFWQWERNTRLRTQYGREYDRAVDELGRLRAQRELSHREQRVRRLHLRPLTREERDRFIASWQAVQAQFIDDPEGAVLQGDRLVEDVMDAHGYPIAEFDQRIGDLSVHHARVVDDYRALREIAHRHRRREASTEDLRQAMVHFRTIFEDLLEDREVAGERVVDLKVEREEVREPIAKRVERVPTDPELRA